MSWAVVVVGAGTIAYKAITAAKQKKEANKLLANGRPGYDIPSEVTQAAGEGLPSEQYAKAMQTIQRNQTTALDRAQNRRGGLGLIGTIQQRANDATLGLDVSDAQARMNNRMTLAKYKDKKWQWENQGKYQEDRNYGMQLLGASNQNINSAVDDLGYGVSSLGYRGAFKRRGGNNGYYDSSNEA